MNACIEECKRDEENFIKSLSEEFNNLGVVKRRVLKRDLSVHFTKLEEDARASIKNVLSHMVLRLHGFCQNGTTDVKGKS